MLDHPKLEFIQVFWGGQGLEGGSRSVIKLFVLRICNLYRLRLRPSQIEGSKEPAFDQENSLCEYIYELRTLVSNTYL